MSNKSKIAIWAKAFRVFTLTGSLMPVLLGNILAADSGHFDLLIFILSIVAIIAFQIGANLINDNDDFERKVDTEESHNSSGVIVDKLLTQTTVRRTGYGFFISAILLSLYPIYSGGLVIGLFILAGIIGGYFYTRKPFEFKYKGLGIPLIFLLFGPMPVLGAYYLQTHLFSAETLKALVVSVMIGLLTTAILHANDIRDIESDGKAGIKTLSILLGFQGTATFYSMLILLPFVIAITAVITGLLPYLSLIVLAAVPFALKNLKMLYAKPADVIHLDQNSAKLEVVYGLLLILSLLIRF